MPMTESSVTVLAWPARVSASCNAGPLPYASESPKTVTCSDPPAGAGGCGHGRPMPHPVSTSRAAAATTARSFDERPPPVPTGADVRAEDPRMAEVKALDLDELSERATNALAESRPG